MSNRHCLRAVLGAMSSLLISACGFPNTATVPGPLSPQDLAAAQAKDPTLTAASVEQGRELFIASCNKCHGHPDVHFKTAEEWPAVVERMRKKADLSEADGHLVLAFILAQGAAR